MALRIVECEYLNTGDAYGVFFLGDCEIGRADLTSDGWLPYGKRKPLTAEMAAKSMIDTMIRRAKADLAHAEKMMDALRMYCGGRIQITTDGGRT